MGIQVFCVCFGSLISERYCTSKGLKKKSLKLADDEQLAKALYTWFIQ